MQADLCRAHPYNKKVISLYLLKAKHVMPKHANEMVLLPLNKSKAKGTFEHRKHSYRKFKQNTRSYLCASA
jgi:hypothetical protein